ncbi:MAG: DUF92 domain-containing protein [Chloroflexi bacterium]|nr:DUF92 domain-containing protein [Chloroflexota bacterium]
MQIFIGFLAGAFIAVIAWRADSLSISGAIAAAVSGGLIFGIGGLPWAALLLIFFITSSVLSKAFKGRKAKLGEKFAKGSQRDWAQVLANDGVGTLLVLFLLLDPDQTWAWLAYAGAMATVNADTWATELGVLNPKPPRLITNGRVVEVGTSGGISLLGTLATLGGAALVGLVGAAFSLGAGAWTLMLAVTLGGVCGSLFDSLLGATVQAIYHCPACVKETERHPSHTCGTETTQIRGWRWLALRNDLVNFLASAVGAIVSAGLWLGLQ